MMRELGFYFYRGNLYRNLSRFHNLWLQFFLEFFVGATMVKFCKNLLRNLFPEIPMGAIASIGPILHPPMPMNPTYEKNEKERKKIKKRV